MLNNRFLGVLRGQAPGITLQLPMDTRINAPGDLCPRNITQSTSISQANFRIGTERNTGLLIRPGKAEVPALDAFGIYEKGKAVVVREGVALCTGFGMPDCSVGESHLTISVSFE
jgi:hypothetical protein